jgi:hypothetical protein
MLGMSVASVGERVACARVRRRLCTGGKRIRTLGPRYVNDAIETILIAGLAFAFLPERPARSQGGTDGSNPLSSSGESHCEPAGHPLKGSRPKPRRVRAPASAIRRRAGTNRAASWPRSGGIRASCTRASASSSPICPAGRTGRRSRPQGCRHRAARRSFRQPGRSRRPDPAQRRHPENPSRPEDRLSAQLGRREGAPRRRRPALTGAGKDRPRGESCGRCAAAACQPGAGQSPGSAKGMKAFALTMRPTPSRVCQPRSLPDVPSLRESRRNIAGRNHRDRQPRPLCLPHTHRDNRFWSRHSEP